MTAPFPPTPCVAWLTWDGTLIAAEGVPEDDITWHATLVPRAQWEAVEAWAKAKNWCAFTTDIAEKYEGMNATANRQNDAALLRLDAAERELLTFFPEATNDQPV